jgi:hypothetical protein
MTSIKFLGYRIQLGKNAVPAKNNTSLSKPIESSQNQPKKRASKVIRKQYKREVSWQINDIKTALVMAENPLSPDRLKLHQIYRYIMRDARLKSQIRDAIMKVSSEPFMLYNGNTPDEKLSEAYRKTWFNKTIRHILESEMHGYSVIEYDELDPENVSIGTVHCFDREYISIEKQLILIEASINGTYLPYKDIMWDIDLVEFFDSRTDYGLLLECAYNILWKYYSRTDWSRASEKWGMPMLKILVDTNSDSELDDYENRAANFGSDNYIIGQKNDEIDIMERSGQKMHDIFLDNIKLCNEEFTLLVNGQTATSDQKSFVGSAEVQERNFEDLTLTRLQFVADQMNEKFLPYLKSKGFKGLTDTIRFDYPSLVRERERKIAGTPTPTDPVNAPKDKQDKKDEKKEEPIKK